ncbi:MAG TPA: DUF502 domain-containing protein [Myxococcaceae bacterium]|jgi:uncharacterized membrane protein
MRRLFRFLGTTFVGGLLVILPIYLSIILLLKGAKTLVALMRPIAELIPENRLHPDLIAAILVVLGCFVAGLIARGFPRSKAGQVFEEKVLEKIPGYSMVRSATRSLLGDRPGGLELALVEMEEGLVVGVVVERHDVGWVTVFIPSTPAPASGAVFLFPAHRLHPVDTHFRVGLKATARYGRGAGALLAGLKDPSILKLPPA